MHRPTQMKTLLHAHVQAHLCQTGVACTQLSGVRTTGPHSPQFGITECHSNTQNVTCELYFFACECYGLLKQWKKPQKNNRHSWWTWNCARGDSEVFFVYKRLETLCSPVASYSLEEHFWKKVVLLFIEKIVLNQPSCVQAHPSIGRCKRTSDGAQLQGLWTSFCGMLLRFHCGQNCPSHYKPRRAQYHVQLHTTLWAPLGKHYAPH